jgi:hypothetical protein
MSSFSKRSNNGLERARKRPEAQIRDLKSAHQTSLSKPSRKARSRIAAVAGAIALVAITGAAPLHAQQSNSASIGASVMSGSNGALAINEAAGVGNQQVNAAMVANGPGQLSVNQVTLGNFNSAGSNSAQIGNNVFAGATGIMQLNQASGSGNLEANAAFIGIGGDASAVTGISLSQIRGGSGQVTIPQANVPVQASIASTAFAGAAGVAQVEQVSGNNNVAANTMALHLGTGLPH